MNNLSPAIGRWRMPGDDVSRDEYFAAVNARVTEYYLADPLNPYQQSGRSSGAARWEETRRCFVQAIHRDGDFLDVGCANGLLLDTLITWSRDAGWELCPHGLDFVPELVALARTRFPGREANFHVGNAFTWQPPRRYTFVRTNIEYVPPRDRVEFIQHQRAAVDEGGRLIVCHYRNPEELCIDLAPLVEDAGFSIGGRIDIPGTAIVWADL